MRERRAGVRVRRGAAADRRVRGAGRALVEVEPRAGDRLRLHRGAARHALPPLRASTAKARSSKRRSCRRPRRTSERRRRFAAGSRTGSSASSIAAWSAASSAPSTSALDRHLRPDDLVPVARDLVHHDPAGEVEPGRRRARLGQLGRERHGQAAGVCRGEQLLGARLALGLADAARKRERQCVERSGPGGHRPGTAGHVSFPDDSHRPFDSRQRQFLSGGTAGVPSG